MWAEWHVMAPWGRIRSKSAPPRSSYTNAEIMANELEPLRHVTSTGDIRGIPVLLAHGRKDCAATFTPLLKHQPGEIFYYVAVDMPGSSTSDPLPKMSEKEMKLYQEKLKNNKDFAIQESLGNMRIGVTPISPQRDDPLMKGIFEEPIRCNDHGPSRCPFATHVPAFIVPPEGAITPLSEELMKTPLITKIPPELFPSKYIHKGPTEADVLKVPKAVFGDQMPQKPTREHLRKMARGGIKPTLSLAIPLKVKQEMTSVQTDTQEDLVQEARCDVEIEELDVKEDTSAHDENNTTAEDEEYSKAHGACLSKVLHAVSLHCSHLPPKLIESVHGYFKDQQDSCIPLQDHSVFGPGYFQQPQQSVKIMRFHFLAAMEVAIQHLGWDKFIFMGHSMGCEIGLFYNAIYPGRMTKMVLLDAEPALRRLQVQDLAEYQAMFYDDYYENYEKHNNYYKLYTIPEAKQALMRARNLPEEAASIIADSSLIHVAGDKYRFSWDYRLTLPAAQNYPNSYYFALFSNIPPTLLISASNSLNAKSKYRPGSIELLNMMSRLKNFSQVVVEGDHDVHLSHPERVAPYVNEFLTKSVVLPSKL